MIATECEPVADNSKDNNYDDVVDYDDDDNLTIYGKIRYDDVASATWAVTNNNKRDDNDIYDSQLAKDIQSSKNYALLVAVLSILLIVVTFFVTYYVGTTSEEKKFQRIAEKVCRCVT
jgi:preprotein translocase subunit SecF